jgi:predicted dehydrogenase
MQQRLFTRRSFTGSGLAAILAAGTAPAFIPARLLGAGAPSKLFTLGFIGVGSHGVGVNLRSFLHQDACRVLAVCDVFKSRRTEVQAEVNQHYKNQDCAALADFREVLQRSDLDAVVISTPDHWHVTMALMALQAGKHVFCEKPTLTIAEGRALADAVKASGKVFATGLEDRSVIHYHKLAEIARNGRLGALKHMEVKLPKKPIFPHAAPCPVPDDLNFDLWLGPAPQRDYFPSLTDNQVWRQIRDFSGGSLTDWGAHLMDTAQVANSCEDSSPVHVSGTGIIPPDSVNTVPREYDLNFTYSNGVTMHVQADHPYIRLEGTDGWVSCDGWRGKLDSSRPEILRQQQDPTTSKLWPRPPDEHRNFLDVLKGNATPNYSAEALHRLSTTMHLGLIAMELGRPLKWDPVKEEFDQPDANRLRSRTMRTDWQRRG